MTSKSFDVAALSITPKMEKSVAQAFNEFAPRDKSFTGNLRRFVSNSSCRHSWKLVEKLPKEHADYLELVTEEAPDGTVKYCTTCGSVSYWEDGQLWLFDATTRYFGKPPKRRRA